MKTILGLLLTVLPSTGILIAFGIYVAFYPEKIEKLSSLALRGLSYFPKAFTFARKKYIKHDLQARVNDFVKALKKEVPSVAEEKLRVEWVDTHTDKKAFIADGSVVIRLRQDDPQDHNFVHGAYFYTATALLQKPKRYLSVAQRESLDLFVCTKLIEREKPHVRGYFVDNYLFPKTKDKRSKISVYLDDFESINDGKLFYPVFLQELEYLGEKVFGRRQDEEIRKEVDELIDFLKPIAQRRIGEENDLEYHGSYCRFGIMLVGKPRKMLTSLDPYAAYFNGHFVKHPTETVYLLGRAENQDKLETLAEMFKDHYEVARNITFRKRLDYDSGESVMVEQCLLILHRLNTPLIRAQTHRGVTSTTSAVE